MKDLTIKYKDFAISVLFGIVVFVFWYVAYPHALSYQEQYQLFLWPGDYFANSISIPGGFADWLGEMVMQFYYVPWMGALLLAVVFVAFARLVGWLPAMLPREFYRAMMHSYNVPDFTKTKVQIDAHEFRDKLISNNRTSVTIK